MRSDLPAGIYNKTVSRFTPLLTYLPVGIILATYRKVNNDRPNVLLSRGQVPMRTVIIVLAASSALLLGGLTIGGTTNPPADAPPPQAVTVAPVPQQAVTEWDEFTGRLEAIDQVEIRLRVSGYIRRVAFTEGREVKKGEVLFEIDPRPYQAELARVEAELESARSAAALAKSEKQRAGTLVDMQAISREEFDSRTSAEVQGGARVRAA